MRQKERHVEMGRLRRLPSAAIWKQQWSREQRQGTEMALISKPGVIQCLAASRRVLPALEF